jgi:hypothetical protein
MQEEYRTDGFQRNAGEGSPEQRGGAKESGGEPSPAWRLPGVPRSPLPPGPGTVTSIPGRRRATSPARPAT